MQNALVDSEQEAEIRISCAFHSIGKASYKQYALRLDISSTS
jgi:hypothetical protein